MNLMLRARNTGMLNVDRVFARILVVVGGAFWVFALLGAHNAAYTEVYKLPELTRGAVYAAIPLAITIVMFALGLFYERLTGTLLVMTAAAMIVWGVVAHWGEVVLWMTAFSALVAPSAFAGVLYILASRTQEVQELIAKNAGT